jgi:hypothetical protein
MEDSESALAEVVPFAQAALRTTSGTGNLAVLRVRPYSLRAMRQRAVLGSGLLIALYASCSAPDSRGLFQPYDPNAPAGAGGSGGSEPLLVPRMPLADASVSEGQGGGALGFAGAAGGGPPSAVDTRLDAGLPADAGDAAAPADAAADCSRQPEICDGLDNDCDGSSDEGNACAATCAGFALEGHGYMFCSDSVIRDVAADRCEQQGMHLAWIETSEENDFLVERITAADVPAAADEEILTYLGGSDAEVEGSWLWRGRGAIPNSFQFWQGQAADNGGRAVGGAYANWSPTEPNDTDEDEDCAVLSVLGNNNRLPGNWDDRSCDSALPFVCEVP